MLGLSTTKRLIAAAVCLAAAGAISACTPRAAEPVSNVASLEGDAPVLEQLTPSQKRSAIATSFPAEVPVPDGRFSRGEAQGDAWDYDVTVDATPQQVAEWYRTQYRLREWILVKDGDFDGPEGGGTFLDFRKNAAESSISVYGGSPNGPTRVRAVVGVGTKVLQSQ